MQVFVNIAIHVVLKMKLCHCKHNVNKWNSHRTSLKWIEIMSKICHLALQIHFWKKPKTKTGSFTALRSPSSGNEPTRDPMKNTYVVGLRTEVMCTCIHSHICGMGGRLHLCDLSLMSTNKLYRGTVCKFHLLQLSNGDNVRPIKGIIHQNWNHSPFFMGIFGGKNA